MTHHTRTIKPPPDKEAWCIYDGSHSAQTGEQRRDLLLADHADDRECTWQALTSALVFDQWQQTPSALTIPPANAMPLPQTA